MSIRNPCWALVLVVSACGGNDGESSTTADTQLLKEQLVDIAEMTVSGLPTEEMTEHYLSYFSDSPVALSPDQSAMLGRRAIGDFYNTAFNGIEILSNEYREIVVKVNGESAVRRYLGTATFRVAEASEPISVTNRYIDVLEKIDGSWRIVWHSWTPAVWLERNDT